MIHSNSDRGRSIHDFKRENLRIVTVFSRNDKKVEKFKGLFHTWSEDNEGDVYALVERHDGEMVSVYYERVKFLELDRKE